MLLCNFQTRQLMTRRQTNNGSTIHSNLTSCNFRLSNRISSYSKDRVPFHPGMWVMLICREAIRDKGQSIQRSMLYLRRSHGVIMNITVDLRTPFHAICPRTFFGITSRLPRVTRRHFLSTYRSGRGTFRFLNNRAIASDRLFRMCARYRHASFVRPIISFLYHRALT